MLMGLLRLYVYAVAKRSISTTTQRYQIDVLKPWQRIVVQHKVNS